MKAPVRSSGRYDSLIPKLGYLVLQSLSFYKLSRIVTYDKCTEQAWLSVDCSILQPIYNCVSQDVHKSQEQVNNTSAR